MKFIKELKKELDFIYKHEENFSDNYAHCNELLEVTFSDTEVKFVFLTGCGLSIVSTIGIEEYKLWKSKCDPDCSCYETYEAHACHFEEEVSSNYDSEYCTCYISCTKQCEMGI